MNVLTSGAVLLWLMLSGVCAATPWHWANPSPQGNSLRAVAYGNNQWIGVGDRGTLVRSPDGVNWTVQAPIGAGSDLNGIAWWSGGWIAVGSDGAILTSTDGTVWTMQASGTWDTLRGIACAPDLCVASGDYGQLIESFDGGSTWWPAYSQVFDSLDHVVWNGSLWVAVGFGGVVVTSPDGAYFNWTRRTSNVPVCTTAHTPCNLFDIGWNGSNWLAVGLAGAEARSSDGINWTTIDNPVDLFWSVAWDGSRWVAVGYSGVYTSNDAQTWTTELTGSEFRSVATHAGTSVVVGTGGALFSSTGNGIWTRHDASAATPGTIEIDAVAYHAGTWLAVGGAGQMLSSPDGAHWNAVPGFDPNLLFTRVTWQGAWFALGDNHVFRSDDAVSWSNVATLPQRLYDLASDGQKYIAVGQYGTIASSPDGITWTQIDTYGGVGPHWISVAYDNALWTIVGDGVLVSSDGNRWTSQPINTGYELERIAAHGGKRIATFRQSAIFVSDDGATWSAQETGSTRFIYAVRWLAGEWFALGQDGVVLRSPDGNQWSADASDAVGYVLDMDSDGNRHVIVGGNGLIQYQDEIIFRNGFE